MMDQIVLMIALGGIKALERLDLGDDGFARKYGLASNWAI